MKRQFFVFCLLSTLSTTAMLAQQLPPLVAQQGYADLVVTNGKIVFDNRSGNNPAKDVLPFRSW